MSQGNDLLLISAVIDASCDEFAKRGLLLSQVTRRLFELTHAGERDFETLSKAVLEMNADDVASRPHMPSGIAPHTNY